MSDTINVPLLLGSFEFSNYNLENPELLGDIGGAISVAQHDFPGGIRTQQTFGYFPAAIRWRARFSGGPASDRAEQVKRILTSATETTLSWGERSWLGLLVKFSPTARHTWLFEYECEFWPRVDQSSGSGESDGDPSPEFTMNQQTDALNSWVSPSSPVTLYPEVSDELTDPINGVLSSVSDGMMEGRGQIALMSSLSLLAIQSSLDTLIFATLPLQVSLDARIASPAWDIYCRALVIQSLIKSVRAPRWTIAVVNPNLFALSSQYYGNAGQWRLIANANGLSDPQPTGDFPELVIPAPPPS